jgi:hypothetical protein
MGRGFESSALMKENYARIYGWLQHVLQANPYAEFAPDDDRLLTACRSSFRVIDGDVLCPIGSEDDTETISKAFTDLRTAGLARGREHLKSASTY